MGGIRDRWVMCDRCGAPLGETAGATSARCSDCELDVPLPPRDDTSLASREPLGEDERDRRLREQDGRPVRVPESIEGLLLEGEIPPYKQREALEIYLADRRRLREQPDPAAQERLVFLTMALAQATDDPVRTRALLETSLDAVTLRRYRQILRGHLAREAARTGDLDAADAWLAPCDPRSDDLEMDSSWRFSRAVVATERGDWRTVLDVLGDEPDAVPIADLLDAVTLVYRAHAHEQLGDTERAARQLADAMAAGKRRVVEEIIARWPEQRLCAASLEAARAEYARSAARSAQSLSNGGIGPILLVAGGLTGAIGVGMLCAGAVMLARGLSEDAVGLLLAGGIQTAVGAPLGLSGWRSMKSARRDARVRVSGLPATGTVLSAEHTGTTINDVPLMKITLRIHQGDRPPWEASTRLLVAPQNTSILETGKKLYVRVDPEDTSRIVLDTG